MTSESAPILLLDGKPRWYRVEDKSGKLFYARKGFGSDGTLVAVCDPLRPRDTGIRLTPAGCRKRFVLLSPLDSKANEEFEDRFMYELHR